MEKRILFLYTEIAGYTVACLNELRKSEVEIFLIRWSVNKEAPFYFNNNNYTLFFIYHMEFFIVYFLLIYILY